ncbi:MAG TPA: DNA starvation/stationary phase protection protein [Pseudonocardia sp.]|jgi:starvation-inducible DNA-binding protein|nr:DNA starvation/stationary phase protection protein [Pseudonocardia sp.]
MTITDNRTAERTSARLPEGAAPGFEASERLRANLQSVLVDLVELHLQGKQAHWNLVGTNFRDLHLVIDEVVDGARELSDTIAERMRALRAVPDGRTDTVAATTSLPAFPAGEQDTREVVELVSNRLSAVAARVRAVHDQVDEDDPTSADLLHQVLETTEKYAWLVGAENR